ncbi:MAG: hypothetical protein ACOVNK_08205, partial [Sphingorhabdus lacus]
MRLLSASPFFPMRPLTTFIMQAAGVLATGFALPVASLPASAQTTPQIITNTATVEWDAGAQRLSRTSNTVQFAVEPAPVPATSLTLLRFSNTPDASSTNLPTTICTGNNGATPIRFEGVYSGLSTSPASLVPATAIRAGEPLVIQMDAATKNLNATAIDSFEVVVVTPAGDRERITLTESATNSGR